MKTMPSLFSMALWEHQHCSSQSQRNRFPQSQWDFCLCWASPMHRDPLMKMSFVRIPIHLTWSRVKEICVRRNTSRQGLMVSGGGGTSRNVFLSFKRVCLKDECLQCALTSNNLRSDGVSLDCSHQRHCFLLCLPSWRWGKKIHTSTEGDTKGCRKCLMSLGREMMSLQEEALCAVNSRSRQESVPLSNGSIATELYLPAQS